MGEVYALQVRDGTRTWWVLADAKHTFRGQTSESKDEVLARWEKAHGRPAKLTTYDGVHSMAEAAMTLTDIALGKD